MPETLLELEDVEARYGQVRALHGVSLTVAEGEVVAVLGANAGRSGGAAGSRSPAGASPGALPSPSRGSESHTCPKGAARSPG